MHLAITTTNLVQLFFITSILFVSIFVNKISAAAAGYCYQCNSRNPLCGMDVSVNLRIDATPCNGQCYTRLNRDDENTISRGCSWEYGFMTPQAANTLVLKGNSVWIFCDTSYCNVEATGLLNNVCYQPICDFLKFPEDCSLPNADVTCGQYCGNQLCGSRPVRRRTQQRQRNRIRSHSSSHNRVRSQKRHRKG